MEVRTVLVALLSRFWFDLAPSMGRADAVRRAQHIALTLKIRGGLQLVCRQHDGAGAPRGGGGGAKAGGGGGAAARRAGGGVPAAARGDGEELN